MKISNAEYHRRPEISHSQIECFRRSQKEFYQRHVARTMAGSSTASQLLGTAVHGLLLDQDAWGKELFVAPECDRRTKAGKELYAEWFSHLPPDAVIVPSDVYQQAALIAASVCQSAYEIKPFGGGGLVEVFNNTYHRCEIPMFWSCPETNEPLRAKADFIDTEHHLIVDLKTCQSASPKAFASAAARYGYVRQAAWYCQGYEVLYGRRPHFVFVAVSTSEPYEVGMYSFSQADIEAAEYQNKATLCELVACRELDDWQATHETEVVELSLPRWAAYEDEYLTF